MPEPEMVARRKLAESRYFLAAVKEKQDEEAFLFELSAFLSASHSIMDIMLYDAAERLELGLTRDDWLDRGRFDLVAKSHRNEEATNFSKWWEGKLGELKQNPIWDMRRFNIHRGYPKLNQTTGVVYVSGWIPENVSDAGHESSYLTSHSGTITPYGPPIVGRPVTEIRTRIIFKLEEAGSRDVAELCQELYDKLAAIVGEAHKKFWVNH